MPAPRSFAHCPNVDRRILREKATPDRLDSSPFVMGTGSPWWSKMSWVTEGNAAWLQSTGKNYHQSECVEKAKQKKFQPLRPAISGFVNF